MIPNDKFKLLVVITLHLGKTHVVTYSQDAIISTAMTENGNTGKRANHIQYTHCLDFFQFFFFCIAICSPFGLIINSLSLFSSCTVESIG